MVRFRFARLPIGCIAPMELRFLLVSFVLETAFLVYPYEGMLSATILKRHVFGLRPTKLKILNPIIGPIPVLVMDSF